jgi:hypothetical protein
MDPESIDIVIRLEVLRNAGCDVPFNTRTMSKEELRSLHTLTVESMKARVKLNNIRTLANSLFLIIEAIFSKLGLEYLYPERANDTKMVNNLATEYEMDVYVTLRANALCNDKNVINIVANCDKITEIKDKENTISVLEICCQSAPIVDKIKDIYDIMPKSMEL